jgi:hypothetical protein
MSDLDIRIEVSRSRLVRLEEHLQFEKERLAKMEEEKLESPLKSLGAIIETKKRHMTHPSPKFGAIDARFYHTDSLNALEPIFNTLKKIEERLDALERK